MVRPCKCRKVSCKPCHNYFKPCGKPRRQLEELTLALDELEAIRLADLEMLYREDAAKQMNISRQTFDRILIKARNKVAEALIEGKAIRIDNSEGSES